MKTKKSRSHQTVKAGTEPPPTPKPRPLFNKAQVPPILLEGDKSAPPPKGGQGHKDVRPQPAPPPQAQPQMQSLPAAYGTRKLLLLARDPHSLYAHWDLTSEQRNQHQALAAGGQLAMRIHSMATTEPVAEVRLPQDAQDQFVNVPQPGTSYVAELGYYGSQGQWISIGRSSPAFTPPKRVSEDRTAEFATVRPPPSGHRAPPQTPNPGRRSLSLGTVAAYPPLTEVPPPAGGVLPEATRTFAGTAPEGVWTTEQESAIGELLSSAPAAVNVSSPQGGKNISSLFGGEQPPAEFWFSLNAELVVYGATQPGARVMVGGRTIVLRPDGTFSLRCALPDGDHALAISAHSRSDQKRHALLTLARRSEYWGEVSTDPQDPALGPPAEAG